MPDPREEAIRLARRLQESAAICAALGVFRARAADDGQGRALGVKMVEGGLLTLDQLDWILGEKTWSQPAPPSLSISPEARQSGVQPEPSAVAVLDPPCEAREDLAAPAELASPHSPRRAADPLLRWLLAAASLLGVSLAVIVSLAMDGFSPSAEPEKMASAPRPAAAPQPAVADMPGAPVGAAVPLPPPPPQWQGVPWPAALRQVREGDSPAVMEGLRSIERELADAATNEPIAFDVKRSLTRRTQRDRLAAWVELDLSHYADVAGLRSTLDCPSETVDIAWIGE